MFKDFCLKIRDIVFGVRQLEAKKRRLYNKFCRL